MARIGTPGKARGRIGWRIGWRFGASPLDSQPPLALRMRSALHTAWTPYSRHQLDVARAAHTRPIPRPCVFHHRPSSSIIFQTSVTHLPCTAHGRRMNHMQPANRAHPRRRHGGAPHRGRPAGVFHARQRAAAKDIRTRHSHRHSRLHSHRHLGVENISRIWHSSACRRWSPEAIGLNSGQPFRMWSRPTKQTQQSGPRWRAQHEPGETGYRPCATQSHSR